MVKKVSRSELESVGGRVITPKPAVPEAKPVDKNYSKEQKEQKRMIEKALLSAHTAEGEALRAVQIAEAQTALMQQLIDKMPVHEGLSPITGFEFQRDADGLATGVTFIREKLVLN